MRAAVITIAAGRDDHLARQRAALDRSVHHVVVAMGDAGARPAGGRGDAGARPAGRSGGPGARPAGRPGEPEARPAGPSADVIAVAREPAGLPLARARNAGARRALEAGADLLVFLDVDCIPGPDLLRRYWEAAISAGAEALLCGPVAYLPPAPPGGYPARGLAALGRVHPARPVPAEDELRRGGDHTLFWTLSFAVTADTWRRVGEFCEDYVGYGGEDTDYGQLARRAGVDMCWVGGAWAYHQYHDAERPPVRHLDDILRNAALFHRRWGWWPMRGWLEAFEARGLVHYDPASARWTRGRRAPLAVAVP